MKSVPGSVRQLSPSPVVSGHQLLARSPPGAREEQSKKHYCEAIMADSNNSKRIVFTTWGSFGDLHPFMGLALEMQARGHRAAIATMSSYREKVQDAGIDSFPMRPDFVAVDTEKGKEIILRIMDLRDGPRYVMQELLAPFTRDTLPTPLQRSTPMAAQT
jgi:Glycosyltransferase family 28 N-terminal domain